LPKIGYTITRLGSLAASVAPLMADGNIRPLNKIIPPAIAAQAIHARSSIPESAFHITEFAPNFSALSFSPRENPFRIAENITQPIEK